MPQSLSNILLHIVFSTKGRAPLIAAQTAPELYRYLASVSAAHGCPAHKIGGTENHIHVCCSLARTQACAKLLEELKSDSSEWMKTKTAPGVGFAWQNGYGAFPISQDQLSAVQGYIENQSEHHATVTFEDELRELLRRYRVAYDERYVWD